MREFRLERVGNMLRGEIGSLIVTDQIKDPRVSSFVSVTDVEMSKDLGYAKVYVSSFQDEGMLKESVAALNHAKGFIQSHVSRKLKLRVTPRLTFYADTSIREGADLAHKIQELGS